MKIIIIGGHLTPALSFIDYVQEKHPQDKLVFIGRKFSQDALQQEAVEHYEVNKRKIAFIEFSAVRLSATFFKALSSNISAFTASIAQAKLILKKQRPGLVLSFGGYLAVPFALAAWQLKIPIMTHEQTLTVGWANRLIGLLAQKIAISYPETASRFPVAKVELTGNPLREGISKIRHPRPTWLPAKKQPPLLLVMGGNQGSKIINELVGSILPEILPDWLVVHQCGRPTKEVNYASILTRQKKRLSKDLQMNYFIKEWLDESDLFWLYRQAFGSISRAGANTTQELAVVGLPAILIPLPHAHGDEQTKNAEWLVNAGGAILLDQSVLQAESLIESLEKLKVLAQPMRENLSKVTLPKNAAEKLYLVAKELV